MKIFFIRSAESVNDEPDSIRKSYPEYKITLSDLGVEQANRCGKFLKEFCEKNNIPLDKALFYTSPFERTRETADIIHDYLHIPILEDIALVEQLFCGDEKYKDLNTWYKHYNSTSMFYRESKYGESPFELAMRTKIFMNSLKGKVVFVVSHNYVIQSLLLNYFHYSPEWFRKMEMLNNCEVLYYDSEIDNKERVIYKGE